MARVTIEKLKGMLSSFELVVLASVRAKDIHSGAPLTIERDDDKDSVIALREIEAGYVKIDSLKDRLITMLQKGSLIEQQAEEKKVNTDEEEELDDLVFDVNEAGLEVADNALEEAGGFEDEDFSETPENER